MPESYLLNTDVLIDVSREVPEASAGGCTYAKRSG